MTIQKSDKWSFNADCLGSIGALGALSFKRGGFMISTRVFKVCISGVDGDASYLFINVRRFVWL